MARASWQQTAEQQPLPHLCTAWKPPTKGSQQSQEDQA